MVMKKRLLILIICFLVFCGSLNVWAESQQTSGITATTVANRVRALLNDPTVFGGAQRDIWSDAQLVQFTNDGIADLCLSGAMVSTTSIGLVTDTPNYQITDDFIGIKGVIYNDAKSLEKGNFFGRSGVDAYGHQAVGSGEPDFWTMHGSYVWVYPMPDGTAAANDIDVLLYSRPAADITSSQAVPTPERYDQALIYYATAQALMRDGRYIQAKVFLELYEQEVGIAKMYDHPFQQVESENKP